LHIELLELLSGKAVYEPDHDDQLDTGYDQEDDPPRKVSKQTKARTTKSGTRATNEEDLNPKVSKRKKAKSTESTTAADEEDSNPKVSKRTKARSTRSTMTAPEEDNPPKASKKSNAGATTSTTAADEEDSNPKASKRTKAGSTRTMTAPEEDNPPKASKLSNAGATMSTTTNTRKKNAKRWLELIPDDHDTVGQESGPSNVLDVLNNTSSDVPLVSTQTDGQTAQPCSLSSLTFSQVTSATCQCGRFPPLLKVRTANWSLLNPATELGSSRGGK
jgi:hypothetical protein